MASFRTYLTLGRVSNLSTVWANVFCAWTIAGGQSAAAFLSLQLGCSFLYVAGMFMNDFCDAEIDARQRPERPIPSGRIGRPAVRNATWLLSATGFALVAWTGLLPAVFALALLASIILYNLTHKRTAVAPVFMALCRSMLYLIAASAVPSGLDDLTLIAAGVAFIYVCGVTYLAREESTTNTLNPYGLILILAPLLAAFYFRTDLFDQQRLAIVALMGAWIGLSFLKARAEGRLIVGRTIGPLLAAIPLLDLLVLSSLGFAQAVHAATLAAFFAIAIAAQRLIPAS